MTQVEEPASADQGDDSGAEALTASTSEPKVQGPIQGAKEYQLRLPISEAQLTVLSEKLGASWSDRYGTKVVRLGEEAADFSLRAIGTMLELRDFIAHGGSLLVQPADGPIRRVMLDFFGQPPVSHGDLPKSQVLPQGQRPPRSGGAWEI